MVHLASIPLDHEINKPVLKGMKTLKLDDIQKEVSDDGDTFTSAIYDRNYAGIDLPRHEMPEREMPREVSRDLGSGRYGSIVVFVVHANKLQGGLSID